jgi:uncharacterized protein (TIGR02271 family)
MASQAQQKNIRSIHMTSTGNRIPATTTRGGVAGLFRDGNRAEKAINELKSAGFSDSEIGVATAHDESKTAGFWSNLTSRLGKHEHSEHAEDFEDSLRDAGIPEQQAGYFNSALAEGGVLVTVHTNGARTPEALAILQRNGADVGTAAAGWQRSTAGTRPGLQRIQLIGEILRVHKERVSRGEVRLRKEVVTENQNIEVPVSREELVIERVAGQGREASGVEVGSGQKEIRVPLTEERVHVEKKPVVNEEVQVGKREVQNTKRVSGDVRHEELRSETEGNVSDEEARRNKTKRTA